MATIKIKQIGSPIRRPEHQKRILVGLGLGKMHRVVELEDRGPFRVWFSRSTAVCASPSSDRGIRVPRGGGAAYLADTSAGHCAPVMAS